MANIIDYLEWRGDINFDVDPFNDVDSLILCEVAYVDWDGIVPSPGSGESITVEEACKRYFELHTKEEILKRDTLTKMAPFAMEMMAHSNRFGGTKLFAYVNEIDQQTQTQFSVVSFILNDGSIYVAYRGTDNTLVGWKEDFNMCFMYQTAGQLYAARYLSDNFANTQMPIRVGGHSKGGNFAVYASAFCIPTVRDKIIEIYSNDGPGFEPQITTSSEYKAVLPKIKSILPEFSVVGMLMDNEYDSLIIESDEKGMMCHDAMSWQVLKNHFVKSDGLVEESILIDKAIKKWYKDVDNETRGLFLDIFFSSFFDNGHTTLSEVSGSKVRSIFELKKNVDSLPEDEKEMFMSIMKKLALSGTDAIKENMLEKLSMLNIKFL